MSSVTSVADAARNHIRDFPQFFEETYQPLQATTFRLSSPLIASLEVRSVADNTEVTDFAIDYRNGVLKLSDATGLEQGVHCYGYHYEWFLDEDLQYFAGVVRDELLWDTDMGDLTDMSEQEVHLVAVGTLMYALYSLMTEFATDIDVSTPEGVMIPAHMRFQQIQQLLQYWQQKYTELTQAYNLGPNKISQYNLRRISRLTNRYVPVFRGREIDDPRWPVRVFPEIPELGTNDEENNGTLVNDYGVSFDGWESFGQSGG